MQFNERGHFNSHAKMKSCKCDKCGKSYQYRSSLLRHTLSCNGLEVVNTHNSFECPTCKTTFQRKDTLSDHIHGVHQKKQKYRCNNCNRSFLWRSSLARHKCQKKTCDRCTLVFIICTLMFFLLFMKREKDILLFYFLNLRDSFYFCFVIIYILLLFLYC